nr:MAG TPA: hypothetical protein [Caudoviricetes sp.]
MVHRSELRTYSLTLLCIPIPAKEEQVHTRE